MPATVRLLASEMGGGGSAIVLFLLFLLFVSAWSQAEQIVRVRDSFELASTLRNASLVSQNQTTSTTIQLYLHDWVQPVPTP